MHAARRADNITWWSMGCASRHTRGAEAARAMAADITSAGCRYFYLLGVDGAPKPRRTDRAPSQINDKIVWTPEMTQALVELRAKGTAIFWCAHKIGVSYAVAVMKCRELGLADRRNRGRKPATELVWEES